MTYTVKNIPSVLHARLKLEAQKHRRSINSEILVTLEAVFLGPKQVRVKQENINGKLEALMTSESSLRKDWNLPQEDKAWQSL